MPVIAEIDYTVLSSFDSAWDQPVGIFISIAVVLHLILDLFLLTWLAGENIYIVPRDYKL